VITTIERPSTTIALSRIPPGDWRVILWVTPLATVSIHEQCMSLGDNLYAGTPWPSREIAEEMLQKLEGEADFQIWRRLGLVDARGVRFFPAACG
jgi:hypothetical protein